MNPLSAVLCVVAAALAAEGPGQSVVLPNGLRVTFDSVGHGARSAGLHARDNRVTRIVLDDETGDYYGYVLEAERTSLAPARYRVRFLTLEAAGVAAKDVEGILPTHGRPLRALTLSDGILPAPAAVVGGEQVTFEALVNAAGQRIGDGLRFEVKGAVPAAARPAAPADAGLPEYDLQIEVEALPLPGRYAARFRLLQGAELRANPRVEFTAGDAAQFRQGFGRLHPDESVDLQAEVRIDGRVGVARIELRRGERLVQRYSLRLPLEPDAASARAR